MHPSQQQDIVPDLARGPEIDRDKARDWSLVLISRGVPHAVHYSRGRWSILVEEQRVEEAVHEIRAFEEENAEPLPGEEEPRSVQGGLEATFWVMLGMMVFHRLIGMDLTGAGLEETAWRELGSVDVWQVHQGQWWRLVTGLTLHADVVHLLSNVAVGGLFLVLLTRELGSGLAWSAVLASGVAGNGVNCLVQDFSHTAIGFSTAVFGAVGVLAGLRAMQRPALDRKQKMAPVAAGLGLVAMLGTGEGNIDIAAHVFGFGSGLVVGLGLGVCKGLLPLSRRGDRLLGGLALAVVLVSWLFALA